MNLSNNRLTGPIPSNLARMTNLELIDLGSNKLTGQIPTEFASMLKLSKFLSEITLTITKYTITISSNKY